MAEEEAAGGCCPPGSLPQLTEDDKRELTGTIVEGEVPIYYVAPPAPSTKAVVVVYDVFGFSGGRIKGCCDALAAAGFHVAMPDVYRGTDIASEGGFGNEAAMAWLKGCTDYSEYLKEACEPTFALLASKGADSIGAIGFCWGAYPVFQFSTGGLIKAGVSCHPSLKIGNMFFGQTVESQCAAAGCPMCFMPAGNDDDHYRDGTLKKLIEANGHECLAVDFPDMKHGWVPRGDVSAPEVARDVQQALDTAVTFFTKHL